MEMSASYPFAPNLFNVDAWNLRDSSAVNDMILFIQSFTDAIIHPNNGQDAPPDQASAFIELVADPNVSSVIQIAMPELWSNEGELLALQNPWIWALGSVTKPFVEGNIGYDEQTLAQQRMANTAAVVLTVLNVLQEHAGLERLYEIDAVKRVFATRLVRLMPH